MEEIKPLVSIIIPSYNHEKYIQQAIESALYQTYQNKEIIIIDDGSQDNTHELLRRTYGKEMKINLLLNKENKGLAARLNEGINLAKGKFICLLGSDDWYLPEKIEKQVERFNTLDNTYGVVYAGGKRFYEKNKKTFEVSTNTKMKSGWILKELLTEPFFIYPISPMTRKECFLKYPFTEKYKAEGEAIYFKIAISYKFDFINESLVVMRDHDYNTGKNISMMLHDNIAYQEELFAHPDFPKNLKYLKNKVLGKIYFLEGWDLIRINKNYREGRRALLKAIQFNKNYLLNLRVLAGLTVAKFL